MSVITQYLAVFKKDIIFFVLIVSKLSVLDEFL